MNINDPLTPSRSDPEDTTDEALIAEFKAGNPKALDTLFARYYMQIYHYIMKETLIHEESFIDDIRQDVFLLVLGSIKSGRFLPQGPGAFRAWLYTAAKNICRNCNYHRMRQPKDIYGAIFDFIPAKTPISQDEEEEKKAKLSAVSAKAKELLSKLTEEERTLIIYLSESKSYKEILADPLFCKFTLAYLKLKIYNTRQKLSRMLKEGV